MALIVEDGTGKADADAYISRDEFRAYCTKRGLTAAGAASDGDTDAAILTATEYADTYRRYKGTTVGPEQALQFPRTGLTDWSGWTVTGVPRRLKDAVCFLTAAVLGGEALYENMDGTQIASEAVGPISTSYVQAASPDQRHRIFPAADKLLAQYVRDEKALRAAPGWTPPEGDATFRTGMMDFSEGQD